MQEPTLTNIRSISTLVGLMLALAPFGCDVQEDPWDAELEPLDQLEQFDQVVASTDDTPQTSPTREQTGPSPEDEDEEFELVADPDAARACCVETCEQSSDFCYDSAVDEHYDRCQDAVIANNTFCSNPPNLIIENACHDDLNDCLGLGSSWGPTNTWAASQFLGCQHGFINCVSTCPV